RVRDEEGRTVVEAIKELPSLGLKTILKYEGGTDRLTSSDTYQNGHVLVSRTFEQAVRKDDGSYVLTANAIPYWGPRFTETFRLGAIPARPLSKVFETGETIKVAEWFDGTAIPRVSERHNRQGRQTESFTVRPGAGMEGSIPYDLVQNEVISFWGA